MTASYYGDLTPIVIAPSKMKSDETIGLNELHQSEPDSSLLVNDHSNNDKNKQEDSRWDTFIECLLFVCCVA